ncbi:MAG TPA: transcription termination/antitermination NusG family protein [Blastocatellia bacterium]|nr:transcription termination/antitermination NusG family protein [Blastocatellia bacterium]
MDRDAYFDIACWYVVYTHPRQEERAEMNLRAWNVQTFAPKIRARRYSSFTGDVSYTTKPMFPRYIFARFKGNDLLHKVNYTRGVHSLVSFNDRPTPVDESIIDLLKSRLVDEQFFQPVDDPQPLDDLQPGDEVEIKSGPLGAFKGIFQEHLRDTDRVRILLQTVSYQAHILVDRDSVVKVEPPAPLGH